MLFVEWKHSGAIAGKPHERPDATRQALCHLLATALGSPPIIPSSKYHLLKPIPVTESTFRIIGWITSAKRNGPIWSPCCTPADDVRLFAASNPIRIFTLLFENYEDPNCRHLTVRTDQAVSLSEHQIQKCADPGRLPIKSISIESCTAYDPHSRTCSLRSNKVATLTTVFSRGDVSKASIENANVVATAYVGNEPYDRKEPKNAYTIKCNGDTCTLINKFVIEDTYPKTEVPIDYSLVRKGLNEKLICFHQTVKII
ncbi:hypothetical protein GJ496_004227 [Pomphorhynchus laevis]|nr:hypothetical protein GJ496_004227 [Pomphorhynchus laevis]